MTAPHTQLFITWVRSCTDGQDHAITDENNAQVFRDGAGLPEALCGDRIAAGSLTIPPGRRCQRCRYIVRARTALFDPDLRMAPRPRRRTLNVLRRLFHRPVPFNSSHP